MFGEANMNILKGVEVMLENPEAKCLETLVKSKFY